MNFFECIEMAVISISSNKLRAVLTMLGIVIGISSVIAIVSIGQAGKAAISSEFDRFGVNVITLKNKPLEFNELEAINLKDYESIKKTISGIKSVTPISVRMGLLKNETKSREVMIFGIMPDYRNIYSVELLDGRLINESDIKSERNVIIVDDTLAVKLFGSKDVIGKKTKLKAKNSITNLTIVGVIKNSNQLYEGIVGEQFPSFVYIPINIAQKIYNTKGVDQIAISVFEKDMLDDVAAKIKNLMERRHRTTNKYLTESSAKQKEQVDSITSILTYMIGSIGAISLIVGGIGVMNIMYVSVTERTREIGIRKALGAQKSDILWQFLLEAVFITMMGGIIGILLGMGVSSIAMGLAGFPFTLSFKVILLAVAFSATVGIVFGVFPAYRAAKLDPITALRYE